MRKLLITLCLLGLTSVCFAEQRYYLQVRFYNDTQYGRVEQVKNYPIPVENDVKSAMMELMHLEQADVDKDQQDGVDAWIYERQNPPPYVEPTKADYISMYNQHLEESQRYLDLYAEKADKKDLEAVKVLIEQKLADINTKIEVKPTAEVIE